MRSAPRKSVVVGEHAGGDQGRPAKRRKVGHDTGPKLHVVVTMGEEASCVPALVRACLGVQDTRAGGGAEHVWYVPQCAASPAALRGWQPPPELRLSEAKRPAFLWHSPQAYLESLSDAFEVIVIEVGGQNLLSCLKSYSPLESLFLARNESRLSRFKSLRFDVIGLGCDLHAAPSVASREFRTWCALRHVAPLAPSAKRTERFVASLFRDVPTAWVPKKGQPLYFLNRACVCLRAAAAYQDGVERLWAVVESQLAACVGLEYKDHRFLSEICAKPYSQQNLLSAFGRLTGYHSVSVDTRRASLFPLPASHLWHVLTFLDRPSLRALSQTSRPLWQLTEQAWDAGDQRLDNEAVQLATAYEHPEPPAEQSSLVWRQPVFSRHVVTNSGARWTAQVGVSIDYHQDSEVVTVELKQTAGGKAATVLRAVLYSAGGFSARLTRPQRERWVQVRLLNFTGSAAYHLLNRATPKALALLARGRKKLVGARYDVYLEEQKVPRWPSELYHPEGWCPPLTNRPLPPTSVAGAAPLPSSF